MNIINFQKEFKTAVLTVNEKSIEHPENYTTHQNSTGE